MKNPYGGCAAGHLAIYIKKTVGHSVRTEWQTVKIVFSLYKYSNVNFMTLYHLF